MEDDEIEVIPPVIITPDTDETPSEIVDEIEEVTDDIDELTETLVAHSIMSEARHEEILEEISECRLQVQQLSTNPALSAENPILTQLLNQMIELRSEVMSLRSSMDLRRNLPIPSELVVPEAETPQDTPNPGASTEEPSEANVENPVPKPARKNRFF